MLEIPERLNYAEWDNVDFALPRELILKENSFLHEAIYVFYAAGGLLYESQQGLSWRFNYV